MGARISNIAYYLPESELTNQELSLQFPDWTPDKIEEKIGVASRRVVGSIQTAGDLAFEAAKKLFLDFDKEKVDFILLCTQSPDYFLPTTACLLQDRLGLRKNIGALDYNLGCSGFVYGLALAKGLIASGVAKTILLITAETYSKYIHQNDKGNRTIFGDAAAATVVEYSEKEQIGEFELGTDGSGYNNLIVHNGASRNRVDNFVDSDSGEEINSDYLYMNGPEIFNFTILKVPKLVKSTILKNNIEKVDYYIFHQANKYMLEYLRKKIKIDEEQFYSNMLQTGNTVSSTIPIALKEAMENQSIKKGDKVLLAGFGVGYSWGATILEI
jgi:3-oxoacyl-[acyl-carrier-protein] synthase-3